MIMEVIEVIVEVIKTELHSVVKVKAEVLVKQEREKSNLRLIVNKTKIEVVVERKTRTNL